MAPFKGANQYTIEITIGTNVKVSHHRGHVLTYPMKNEMPFIHHIISGGDVILQLKMRKAKMEGPKDI